jgi:hypothetical protein
MKLLLSTTLLMIALVGCQKEENKIYYEGGTNPVLSANRTTTIPLSFVNKDVEAVKFSWTNPNYQFTTGLSSQDVFYKVEIDTTNAAGTINPNFTYSGKQTIAISKDLSLSITQGLLNDYLLNQLQLLTTIPHTIQIRVIANMVNGSATLISNVLRFTVTPYAIPPKVDPPASGSLFMVGNATPGGWNNPVPVPSQQFTRVSTTLFQINSIALTGGNSYLLLPVNGDWSAKYGGLGANNTNNPDGDDFRPGGGDLLAPAASGNYKIVVDFQRGKFTLTKL